jgi:CubicO group peptidase (beta-lactamase class C family)
MFQNRTVPDDDMLTHKTCEDQSLHPAGQDGRTDDWELAKPAEQGMDSELLEHASRQFRATTRSAQSLMVVRNGKIVLEQYYQSPGPDHLHPVACVAKSCISAVFGIALEQGLVGSVADRLVDYFPDVPGRSADPLTQTITLRHLLNNTAGFHWPHTRGGHEPMFTRLWRSRDPLEFMLSHPVADPPGTAFIYNGACAWLLTAILDRTTPNGALAFAEESLFRPLGICRKEWDMDPRGLHLLSWGLRLRPRDMAKLGSLYLNRGRWHGVQVVPQAWVLDSWTDPGTGYGYLWWIGNSAGHATYRAQGGSGALIAVVPDLDLVVVTTGKANRRMYAPVYAVGDLIIPAVTSAIVES